MGVATNREILGVSTQGLLDEYFFVYLLTRKILIGPLLTILKIQLKDGITYKCRGTDSGISEQ